MEDDGWINALAGTVRTWGVYKTLFWGLKTLPLFEMRFYASGAVLDFLDAFSDPAELYFLVVSWDYEYTALAAPVPAAELHSQAQPRDRDKKMLFNYLFMDPKFSLTLVTE